MEKQRVRECWNSVAGPAFAPMVFCPACRTGHQFVIGRWTFNGNFEAPTFAPSMLIRRGKGPEDFPAQAIVMITPPGQPAFPLLREILPDDFSADVHELTLSEDAKLINLPKDRDRREADDRENATTLQDHVTAWRLTQTQSVEV